MSALTEAQAHAEVETVRLLESRSEWRDERRDYCGQLEATIEALKREYRLLVDEP